MAARSSAVVLLPSTLLTLAATLPACDSCGCHLPSDLAPSDYGWDCGLFTQYTDFSTLKDEGQHVANRDDQYLHSLTLQATLGYRWSDTLALSVFAPYISRSYSRPDGDQVERGTVAGLGDASAVASIRLLHVEQVTSAVMISALIGLKIPTGDPSQLKYEEQGGGDQDPASATGGHDLSLGAGAWDPLVGVSSILRYDRWFAVAQCTYSYNTEGAYEYRFANELSASAGVGYFLYVQSPWRVSTQLNVTGDSKGLDSVSGQKTDDTANHNIFVGVEGSVWWQHAYAGDLACDLPCYEHNSSTQLVPTWRLRGSISWFF